MLTTLGARLIYTDFIYATSSLVSFSLKEPLKEWYLLGYIWIIQAYLGNYIGITASVLMLKTCSLYAGAESNLRDRIWGEVEKNSFIALPGKGVLLAKILAFSAHRSWMKNTESLEETERWLLFAASQPVEKGKQQPHASRTVPPPPWGVQGLKKGKGSQSGVGGGAEVIGS